MKGEIKAIDGIYPITVMNAVKVGDGTSKNLTEYLQQLNLNGGMQADPGAGCRKSRTQSRGCD